MESPVKKLDFGVADKENRPLDSSPASPAEDASIFNDKTPAKVTPVAEETSAVSVVESEECDEPLLQENPQRFVLFPIKYHEVRNASDA